MKPKEYIKMDTAFVDELLEHYLEIDSEIVFQRGFFEDVLEVADVTLFYIERTDVNNFNQLISVLSYHSSSRFCREQFFKFREENTHKLKMTITKFVSFNLQLEEHLEEISLDENISNTTKDKYAECIHSIRCLIYSLGSFVPDFKVEFDLTNKVKPTVEDLKLSGLPKFNLQQRYEVFKRLGFDKAISQLDTSKQKSRDTIIALLMGISPDNAKQLLNGTYRKMTDKDKTELAECIDSLNVTFKHKQKGLPLL